MLGCPPPFGLLLMATTSVDRSPAASDVRTPSVLVVLVTRNAIGWLRDCLESLAAQTHPRLGVIAVDNGSTDGTRELLRQALGDTRVVELEEDRGVAGALSSVSQLPPAQAADYVLLMHDDVALAPDAVERLLDGAEGIKGVERVGIVGPKILDWDRPRILREVGRSTDRFGHPYTPLQDGELDQGQYDRVVEVLFVSSAVMLVSRDAWQRTGSFDERFAGHHDDLDFCWRARLSGFRVLMTPFATARHRGATARGERAEEQRPRSARYYAERAALASMLKDYGVLTLLWLLPLYGVLGLARIVSLALSRRFEDAYDLLAAWGWNLVHLPGTVKRRVRVQSLRSVADRRIRPFMHSALRAPRWFERAEEIFDEDLHEFDEEELGRPLPRRAAGVAASHPVLLGSILAIGLLALAVRPFVGPFVLTGGALPAFPSDVVDLFRELASGVRTTVLGGVQPGSPALAGLGAGSWLAFANTALAQKILLGGLPALAGIAMYRSMARVTGSPAASVVAAAAYVLSATMLWAFSEGRLSLLVSLAILPLAWDRIETVYGRPAPERPLRLGVGLGVALAIGISFAPSIVLPVGAFVAANLLAGRRRWGGTALVAFAALAGAALAFPVLIAGLGAPASALASLIGTSDPWFLLRLAPGDGPGTWAVAAFLPIAAIVCFAGVGDPQRGRAWRALIVAISGTALAWASVSGYLPLALTNAPAWLAGAAVAESTLVALALATFARGLGRYAFGVRQLGVVILAIVLSVGLFGQALQVAFAEWAVGANGLPPAWPVIASSAPGGFRILWLGTPNGDRFPAPGGDPIALAEAADRTLRFGLTDRDGITVLDEGRARSGPGYRVVREILVEMLTGGTQHAGAMLGPLGVRFIVAADGDLPVGAMERLTQQLDLDRVPAGGLTIFRNAAALPTAFVSPNAPVPERADLEALASSPDVITQALDGGGETYTGDAPAPGHVVVAQQFDGGWRIENAGRDRTTFAGYGWAIAAAVRSGDVRVHYTRQWLRTAELFALALLWIVALWLTRRPGAA